MRYDLKILWVDDVDTYFKENKEIIEMYVEDLGLTVQIEYIQNAQDLLDRLEKEQSGFKIFDMFFIDYSLSLGILGSNVIKQLRNSNVDSDILFYSSEHEADIREAVTKDLGSFEGVYIANRNNFDEKSNYLIKKNSKRLSSLSNIRGLLTDQTSQNDFIVNSYVLSGYQKLKEDQQSEIGQMVLSYMKDQQREFNDKAEREINIIEISGIKDVKKLFKFQNFLFPLELKYQMFQKMIEYNNIAVFGEIDLDDYKEVTQLRNKLAHKKLELCGFQQHIICSDNIEQHRKRMCPPVCDAVSTEGNRISLDQWDEMRKKVVNYGKCFDVILEKLMEEEIVDEKTFMGGGVPSAS